MLFFFLSFYFSGTSNALHGTDWLGEDRKSNSESALNSSADISLKPGEISVFCSCPVLRAYGRYAQLSTSLSLPCLDLEFPSMLSSLFYLIARALWCLHDSRPPGSQLPCWLLHLLESSRHIPCKGLPLHLMHGSWKDRGQRKEEEHAPLVDFTFLARICISQCSWGTPFCVKQQCSHAGKLVSWRETVLPCFAKAVCTAFKMIYYSLESVLLDHLTS